MQTLGHRQARKRINQGKYATTEKAGMTNTRYVHNPMHKKNVLKNMRYKSKIKMRSKR